MVHPAAILLAEIACGDFSGHRSFAAGVNP
jgi:hypothetical protein